VPTLSNVEPGASDERGATRLVPLSGRVCGVCGQPLGVEESFVDGDGRIWAVCRSCAGPGR
jgi:hypothetical protein